MPFDTPCTSTYVRLDEGNEKFSNVEEANTIVVAGLKNEAKYSFCLG
jgi:hypothetical protein